jgi:uncharacterized protein (DUF1800 family)
MFQINDLLKFQVNHSSRLFHTFLCILLIAFLTSCGIDDNDVDDEPSHSFDLSGPDLMSKQEAFRFLNQATLGATESDAHLLMKAGFSKWLEWQFNLPASLQTPYIYNQLSRSNEVTPPARIDIWLHNALHGEDQLRQRVALALSEIMVVSSKGSLSQITPALTSYHDMLANNAFGNYRDLLEDVTLHPAMGIYLSMLGNRNPDIENNVRPDENYAREVLQLFSIGLVELNQDGSVKKDPFGDPIPTYTQEIVEGFAHVFTGWDYNDIANNSGPLLLTDPLRTIPMEVRPKFHDYGPKTLLNGVTLPMSQTGEKDLEDALDNIFEHPNLGPFIATRLIQRLVTSNPTHNYIENIADVFNDNGEGVRGDLGAVVRAILFNPEARWGTAIDTTGKLKEPLLRVTQIWRAYDATPLGGGHVNLRPAGDLGQGPLQAESVFNFFSPFYAPSGEIMDAELVAPELQLSTDYLNALLTNFLYRHIVSKNSSSEILKPGDIYIDISEEIQLTDDPEALIEMISQKLLAGQISDTLRSQLHYYIEQSSSLPPKLIASRAIFLVASSPEFARQI